MHSLLAGQSEFLHWLWRSSWQASLLVPLVLLAQWLFRKHLSPGWKHGLWMLVLARLALPGTVESRLSLFNLATSWAGETRAPVVRAALSTVVQPAAPLPTFRLQSGLSGGDSSGGPGTSAEPAAPRASLERASEPLSLAGVLGKALPFCWLAGVLFQGARLGGQNVRFALRLRQAPGVRIPSVHRALEDSRSLMRVRREIVLIETGAVKSPALYGLFRPRLLLPSGMTTAFTPDELRWVFLHELAHIKRLDMAVNWLMTALQALHWFNPVLWFAFDRMRADRESAADALVLSCAAEGENRSYGEVIIKILAGINEPASIGGLVGILEDRHQITQRIRLIAEFKRGSSAPILAVVLFAAFTVTTLTDAQSEKTPAPPPGGQTSTPPPAKAATLEDSKALGLDTQIGDSVPSGGGAGQPTGDKLSDATRVQDGRMLFEMGKLDEAEAKLKGKYSVALGMKGA